MFLRNFWYVGAYASEVGQNPLARTLLGEPVLLYRTEAGKPVALEDRCCHRNLPLSLGRIEGDAVRCGYHGLKFDAGGACIEIPGQAHIPPGARVKTFPLIERWQLLWIWMGDAARADERLLPDWSYIDRPGLASVLGNDAKPLYMKCQWELNNDNLLDLSHVFYVHRDTLGSDGADRFPVRTERGPRGVRMGRWIQNVPPIPLFAQYLGYSGNVDRWQGASLEPATHCAIDAGFAPVGAVAPDDEAGRDRFVRFRAFITATPETAATTFMFYLQCRNFAVDNATLDGRVVADFRRVFGEDIAVMEAQQRRNEMLAGAANIDINVDAPPLAMRRLLRQLMAAESVAAERSLATAEQGMEAT